MVLIRLLSLWVSFGVGQSSLKYIQEKLNKTKQKLIRHCNIAKVFRAVLQVQPLAGYSDGFDVFGLFFFPWHQEWDDN